MPAARARRHNTNSHSPTAHLTPQVPGAKASTMNDTFFLLGLATGIAFAYLYNFVRQHQRRKRRRLRNQEAIRDRY